MLLLPFTLDQQRYALPAHDVIRIIPCIPVTPVSHAPAWLCGLCRINGASVPVLDLACLITGKTHENHLSARMVLLDTHAELPQIPLIGLILEQLTTAITVADAEISEGLELSAAPWRKGVAYYRNEMLHILNWRGLLVQELRVILTASTWVIADVSAD